VKQGRVVVITGAAGGIGSVLVDRFLANGDTVIATDATKERLGQLADSRNAGPRILRDRSSSWPRRTLTSSPGKSSTLTAA
jgi:NAD(P)-dependent dehydrogenase (short-subunit alcohol dehydrogenase family)